MSAHALLSPSGAHRWLTCTPSAQMEAGLLERSSIYADEGTVAHSLGELLIRYHTGMIKKKDYAFELDKIKKLGYQQGEEFIHYYDQSMYDYCLGYAEYVIEKFNEAQTITEDAQLHLEKRLDLSKWVKESFGTGDVGIIAEPLLTIIDLKYGKGIKVDAEDNEQLMLYALGWLEMFDVIYDIKRIKMIIYQPRLDSFSEFEISVSDLKRWANGYLKPRAELAWNGEGDFAPGDACQWCKAKHSCRALADHLLEVAVHEFDDPTTLADEDVSNIIKKSAHMIKWLQGFVKYALKEAINGKVWPGLKIVEGVSKRIYTDKDAVKNKLKILDFDEEDFMKPAELKGITDVTKLIGKKVFEKELSSFVIKPTGKPALVSETDKRPAMSSLEDALKDFEEDIDEDE